MTTGEPDAVSRARDVYKEANNSFRDNADAKEERMMVLEAWRTHEVCWINLIIYVPKPQPHSLFLTTHAPPLYEVVQWKSIGLITVETWAQRLNMAGSRREHELLTLILAQNKDKPYMRWRVACGAPCLPIAGEQKRITNLTDSS